MFNHQQQVRHGSGSSSSASSNPQGALAALTDWAVRNLDPEIQTTPLQAYVERCCHPSNNQPNLALNLELADYVNQKKANSPREAAFETVKKINSRNPHIGMLGLALLDILVKNCGYPFHLQIATKEFLNEMVKRFPERPSMFPSPVQSKILELIHEWKLTICVAGKHKDDLAHIRDMHRLLSYKGYRFPSIDSRAASVMNPENNLKSPEELEEEDRLAQGAKLQELIRRGTPRDLAQAQELMKIMSGAEPENKPDYSQQTRKELDKVQSRAILLNDMLNNAKPGEKFVKGDAYDQISSHLRSVQPRIQKWISEAEDESGESESMDRLLLINDLINQIYERYKQFTKGNFEAHVNIDPSIDPSRGGADAVPTAKISDLINFDDEPPSTSASNSNSNKAGGSSILDDFASLTFDNVPSKPTNTTSASTTSIPSTSTTLTPASSSIPTGPGGLPTDLFSSHFPNSNSGTSTPSGGSNSLGGWGALQLPTTSSSSTSSPSTTLTAAIPSSSTTLTDTAPLTSNVFKDFAALTPTPTTTTKASQNGANLLSQQSPSTATLKTNDPFADLDAMFK